MNPYAFALLPQLFLSLGAPAWELNAVFGVTWNTPVAYSESWNGEVCNTPQAAYASVCRQTLLPYDRSAGQYIAGKAVLLTIKTKVTFPATLTEKYCQADVEFAPDFNTLSTQNHVAYIEGWGHKGVADRRISFHTFITPVAEDGSYSMQIRKQIIADCQVDISVYMDGYFK